MKTLIFILTIIISFNSYAKDDELFCGDKKIRIGEEYSKVLQYCGVPKNRLAGVQRFGRQQVAMDYKRFEMKRKGGGHFTLVFIEDKLAFITM